MLSSPNPMADMQYLLDMAQDKIQQLEKENEHWREMYLHETEYHQEVHVKIIERLEKENAELKTKVMTANVLNYDHEDYIEHLKKQRDCLKSKLASIKYLNRQEVEKILEGMCGNHCNMFWGSANDFYITAICSLALPEIDKEITK